ncbi:MAG: hypothetical protein N4J56_007378 [Chroococcidiopsis sp. SAG 2025]|uniref:hypothetical protein n=1 Tax=Chroococcidiopsis sp. SAG 2025 TaxID=171389 RepID=UPI00293713AE|nr:hypothetical protein [Chroococcidiopsis sp. SAG 2025]MDV2997673.1 hypothetical protein [Chroococcidiopsis sp. SAG 2025]
MSRNNLRQKALDTATKIVAGLRVGDFVESTHPYYGGAGMVYASSSNDGAVVQLASGERQYIPMKYLRSSPAQGENLCSFAMESSVERVGAIAPAAISADVTAVESVETLTPEEERERHRLELRVESAFFEAGKALRELRERRLYRSTHKSWEAYCQERFGFGRDSADIKISASRVVEEIREDLPTNRRQILPTTLEQVRPLLKLKASSERIEAWRKAIDTNHGKIPNGRIVKGIVKQLKEKGLRYATEFCSVGDVFVLTKLEDHERKYNGCPCVAIELRQFTICVDVHDTNLTVKPENLQKLDSPEAHRQLPQILRRIQRLRQVGTLDRGANHFLAGVGRQVYLTEVEEMLLSCLEAHYKVEVEDCRSHPNH